MKYKYFNKTGNQYTNEEIQRKIVGAKYVDSKIFNGNPLIESLPLFIDKEILLKNTVYIPMLDVNDGNSTVINNFELMKIDDFRIVMPFHFELFQEVQRLLAESYSKRKMINNFSEINILNTTQKSNLTTIADKVGESINGLSLLGVAGSGKSTAINMILGNYPQVIIHEIDKSQIVQVVYLTVVCEANSNFSALYRSIARALDRALCNNGIYEKEISRLQTLGLKSGYLKDLIEKFSIGLIVFDEIQNIDLTSTKENSIEALLVMNNQTHVGMCVVGTEDAFYKLFSKDRTIRRFSSFINSTIDVGDINKYEQFLKGLFLTNKELLIYFNKEVVSTFYNLTDGVLDYTIGLFKEILKDIYINKNKVQITPDYIKNISSSKRKIIHDIVLKRKNTSTRENIERREVLKAMKEEIKEKELSKKEDLLKDIGLV